MATHDQRDPDAIERDIKQTQRDMSATVDQLSDQMSPRNIINSLLDKTENGDIDGRQILDQAKRNPLALAMVGGGLLWLISDKDARPSALTPNSSSSDQADNAEDDYSAGWESHDRYHRGYVDHMSTIEPGEGEDSRSYLTRRNRARSNYLMVEQRHDEDENSFSERLDQTMDKMREQRDNLTNRVGDARRSAGLRAKSAAGTVSETYRDNPLVGGLIAAAVGAIAGSAIPLSQSEKDTLGDAGEKVVEQGKDKVQELAGQARQTKDELVDKADRKLDKNT